VETYELLLCAGMVAALLGDAAFQGLPGNWRWMVGAPVAPALLLSREAPAALRTGLPPVLSCPGTARPVMRSVLPCWQAPAPPRCPSP
jgi:hypothetical protein